MSISSTASAVEFIEARNRRIAEYVAEHPPEIATRPLWSSPRFEAVLAHAEAVGQRVVLGELLGAGDCAGLYARPYVASVMFTPPTNWTRMLFTASIPADEMRRQLGPADQERFLDETDSAALLKRAVPLAVGLAGAVAALVVWRVRRRR